MSSSTAIGRVGESLKELLEGEITVIDNVNVTLLAPDENASGGSQRINLFLYKVQENMFLRNQDWQMKRNETAVLSPTPLSLNLFYLMTPYANSDSQTGNITAHEILGDAMRVFHENPVFDVEGDYLAEDLVTANEQVKITTSQLDLDELSKIWSTFSEPFRLSVPYEVSVIQIDQAADKEKTMPQRVSEIGVPDIRAPYQPPVVHTMIPQNGIAGSTITFSGKYLQGWRAYVSIGRRIIVSGQEITGDSFDIDIPADLAAGFHKIRVDVSRLFRMTFIFEVTV